MGALATLWGREWASAWAGGGGPAAPMSFFLAMAALSAFAIGADPNVLGTAAPGVVVIGFALVAILGFEHLFQADLESGRFDQLALGPWPMEAVVMVKILARAGATLVPVALVSPLAGVMSGMPLDAAVITAPILALAAPGLIAAGAPAAALAAGQARGGLLIAVITPPLIAAPMIFAAGAVRAASVGDPAAPAVMLLAASTVFALTVGVLGAAAAIRMHMD